MTLMAKIWHIVGHGRIGAACFFNDLETGRGITIWRMHSYGPVPPPGNADQGRRSGRRWVAPLSVVGVLAVLVPVLWVTGGFKETPKQPLEQPGKKLDLGLFEVTVRDARIGMADAGFGDEQERFLIVRMRVANKGKETESLGRGGLADGVVAQTKNGKWVEPEQVEGVAGGSETDAVQPGLPVEAAAMWKLNPADSPEKLTVGLRKWKYDHGFTDENFNWLVQREDDKLVGRLTLPVAAVSAAPRPSAGAVRPTAPARSVPGGTTRSPRPTASRR